ncbi:Zn-dependent alcohol dehydrogenase [Actinomycetospora sp. OC33-EN08]|uniref:Zn-dependent alcohol dehydrogenase n=1 Tax=Actinomycetospora aurantiaca TaxID=3129233 RepID=A0ABU8MTG0_9PSEU
MRTTAAVLHEVGKPLEIEEIELDEPGEGEVLLRYTHAGLCRSDLHVMQGDIAGRLPMVLGHEGAGIVEGVGPGVSRVAVGDHVVCSFVPSCGSCHWCATGQQAICDWGAGTMRGPLPGERWVLRGAAGSYGAMCMLGTFAGHGVVHQNSTVRIDPDIPLAHAALVGCGVPTGWGSAVNAADVRPGDTVLVYGAGGIGVNAVQGARFAGARHVIAVDPVTLKRETALRMGATHAVAEAGEAQTLATELTRGVGATAAIVTVSTMHAQVVTEAFAAIGKAGTVVLVSMAGFGDVTVSLPGTVATLWKKTIKGSLFGDCNPTTDIPRLLDLYRDGALHLEELVTATYSLEDVNRGYDDLVAGRLVRGVIAHDAP